MPNAPSTLNVVKPGDVGLVRIGHTGAFRRDGADALWPMFERAFLELGCGSGMMKTLGLEVE
jgi:hypothetical protein